MIVDVAVVVARTTREGTVVVRVVMVVTAVVIVVTPVVIVVTAVIVAVEETVVVAVIVAAVNFVYKKTMISVHLTMLSSFETIYNVNSRLISEE